ncbi:hypothetical protein OB919_13160 [Halobacteria archaeon AArc-curdl1]|uniref:Uncharacterized protein n=1 Tax=Natronosalvus hydrolyticus TaxID=2979988 RepID=A0AAP2ZBG7_9EURY|nr:hypothetical protein [Halobacteria archaeon AArc-curdl1]
MRNPGILWMLQVAAGLSMAGPMYIVAVEFARSGDLLFGALMFVFGTLALFAPNYLLKRIGGPRAWIKRRLARRRKGDSSEPSASSDASGPSEVTGSNGTETSSGRSGQEVNADARSEPRGSDDGGGLGVLERLRNR